MNQQYEQLNVESGDTFHFRSWRVYHYTVHTISIEIFAVIYCASEQQ